MNNCVANISAGGIRLRLISGVVMVCAALVVAVVLVFYQVDWRWRTALVVPFWLGALSYFAGTHKT